MEIKKILYVLLPGVLLCLVFAGVLKYAESVGKEENIVNQPTASPYIQANKVQKGEVAKETVIQVTREPEEGIMEPTVDTMEPAEKPVEDTKEVAAGWEEQISPMPVITEAPVMAPTSEPAPKKEEIPAVQNTPLPVSPTEAPQETPSLLPQSTQPPMLTKEPPVEEEVHVHEFEKAVWELPTCQKGGYYNNICKTCGFEESVTQEPLPHQVKDVIIQEGNCMEDRVIRHICTECEIQVGSDTRYPLYDVHKWGTEEVDGKLVEYCERCGVVK